MQALLNIDTTTHSFSFEELASDSGYVVPEPGSLASRKMPTKTEVMFRSWLIIQGLCLTHLSAQPSHVRLLFGRVWSILLTAKLAIDTARDSNKAAEK